MDFGGGIGVMKHLRHAILVGLVALLGNGCQQARVYDAQALRGETFTVYSPYQVLPPVASDRSAEAGQPGSVALAWWQVRNEPWLNVRRGGRSGQWMEYQIITEDRQRSYDDRIRNYHRRTSRTVRYGTFQR